MVGRVRKFEAEVTKLNHAVNIYDIVLKGIIFMHLFYLMGSVLFYATYVIYGSER